MMMRQKLFTVVHIHVMIQCMYMVFIYNVMSSIDPNIRVLEFIYQMHCQ
jgi:hypothetical protein